MQATRFGEESLLYVGKNQGLGVQVQKLDQVGNQPYSFDKYLKQQWTLPNMDQVSLSKMIVLLYCQRAAFGKAIGLQGDNVFAKVNPLFKNSDESYIRNFSKNRIVGDTC